MRKKRRARRVKSAAVAVATIGVWAAVGFLMVKSLDHPGEQHITGSEYMAEIGYHAERQTAIEVKTLVDVAEVEALVRASEMAKLYDVPLDAELQFHIIGLCEEHHIDPAIVMAMIWKESRFHADSVGDGGNSLGLMQIQPRWHSKRMEKLGCTDLLDPHQNVMVGIDYLAEQLDRFDGDIAKALVGYNQYTYKGTVTAYAKSVLEKAEELRGERDA